MTTTIPSPTPAAAYALDESIAFGNGALWWSGSGTGTLWRVDPRTARIVATIRVASAGYEHPFGIATGEGAVWVTIGFNGR